MADAEADDSESWLAAAAVHPELAAHQIIRLKNPRWNPTWRDLLPPTSVSVSVDWGSRGKRSRASAAPTRIRVRYAAACGVAASPATPLDFGSGSGCASASGSEEPSCSDEKREKRTRTTDDDVSGIGGPVTKAGGIERLPLSFGIAAAKDSKRSGKKKTICELQDEEKLLIEQRIILQKEVELRTKACKALQEEKKRLESRQSSLQLESMLPTIASNTVSSAPTSGTSKFLLPDLNEPLSDNLD